MPKPKQVFSLIEEDSHARHKRHWVLLALTVDGSAWSRHPDAQRRALDAKSRQEAAAAAALLEQRAVSKLRRRVFRTFEQGVVLLVLSYVCCFLAAFNGALPRMASVCVACTVSRVERMLTDVYPAGNKATLR
jgi:hypothetical protein